MVMTLSSNGTAEHAVPGIDELADAPDAGEILSLFRDAKNHYKPFHDNCRAVDDYYFGRKEVPHPEGMDEIRTAKARAIINTATDHVDVNNVTIDVPAPSQRAQARAERVKKFLLGAWMHVDPAIRRTAVQQANMYGISFFKRMFKFDLWPEHPPGFEDFDGDEDEYKEALADFMEKRSITFPFWVDAINPKNLVWDDSRTGVKWAIEFYDRPAREVRAKYTDWTSKKGSDETTVWMEYWDEEWAVYLADNEIVWSGRHGYGFNPFTPVYPVNAVDYDSGPPEERYIGIILPVRHLLDEHARLLTQISAIIRQVAWRTLDFSGPQAAAQWTAEHYEMFGSKNVVLPNVEVEISPMAQVPPDLWNQLNIIENQIEEATYPNVIRGVRPRGVSSGFGISVLAGMGRLVFQRTADAMATAAKEINVGFLKLIENKVRGKVTVRARSAVHSFDQTIGPDDIRGFYENTVILKAEAPEEREREALLAMRLFTAGIISKVEAMRRSGLTNPLEEMVQIGAEQMLDSPEFVQSRNLIAAERLGLLNQLAQVSGAGGPSGNVGNLSMGGATLPRLGEAGIQQQRVASRNQSDASPSVFPQGFGGLDNLAALGTSGGGAQGMPSGQTVGRN